MDLSFDITLDTSSDTYTISGYAESRLFYRKTSNARGEMIKNVSDVTYEKSLMRTDADFLCHRNSIQIACGAFLMTTAVEFVTISTVTVKVNGPTGKMNIKTMKEMFRSIFNNLTIFINTLVLHCSVDHNVISELVCFWADCKYCLRHNETMRIKLMGTENNDVLTYYALHHILNSMMCCDLKNTVLEFNHHIALDNGLASSKLWENFTEHNKKMENKEVTEWKENQIFYKI